MSEESSASTFSIGPTVRRLAYLKTADKIRVALINTTGSCPFPLVAIERELTKIEKARDKGVYTGKFGEPRARFKPTPARGRGAGSIRTSAAMQLRGHG